MLISRRESIITVVAGVAVLLLSYFWWQAENRIVAFTVEAMQLQKNAENQIVALTAETGQLRNSNVINSCEKTWRAAEHPVIEINMSHHEDQKEGYTSIMFKKDGYGIDVLR